MIEITKWDKGIRELEDLYSRIDQSCCLVQMPVPLDENATQRYMEGIRTGMIGDRSMYCYAVIAEGRLAGKIEVTVDDARIGELDLVIDRELVSRGYGSEALSQFMALLKKKQAVRGITAYVNEENFPMIRVLEKNGFRTGRRFRAQVLDISHGNYVLKTVSGIEYVRIGL